MLENFSARAQFVHHLTDMNGYANFITLFSRHGKLHVRAYIACIMVLHIYQHHYSKGELSFKQCSRFVTVFGVTMDEISSFLTWRDMPSAESFKKAWPTTRACYMNGVWQRVANSPSLWRYTFTASIASETKQIYLKNTEFGEQTEPCTVSHIRANNEQNEIY